MVKNATNAELAYMRSSSKRGWVVDHPSAPEQVLVATLKCYTPIAARNKQRRE